MNKNAVVLILAVLFLAMILVVVNQLIYSDPTQPTNIAENNATQTLGTTPLDSTPLASSDETPGSVVSASEMHKSEPSAWAKAVEAQNNTSGTPTNISNNSNNTAKLQATPTQVPVINNQTTTAVAEKTPQTQAPTSLQTTQEKNETEKVEPKKVTTPEKYTEKQPEKQIDKQTNKPEKESTAPPRPRSKGPAKIEKIGLHFVDKKMLLKVVGDTTFESKAFLLTAPDRLVVDFPEPITNLTAPSVPSNRIIKDARIGKQPKGYRLVLDLNTAVKIQTKNNKAGMLEIYIEEK